MYHSKLYIVKNNVCRKTCISTNHGESLSIYEYEKYEETCISTIHEETYSNHSHVSKNIVCTFILKFVSWCMPNIIDYSIGILLELIFS